MDECYYCRYRVATRQPIGHDPHCPQRLLDTAEYEAAKAKWEEGYQAGRSRKELPQDKYDTTWAVGWVAGDIYADTRDNVFESDYYDTEY